MADNVPKDFTERRFILETLCMALGNVLMQPDTETKSHLVERLKRSIEKIRGI